MRTIAFLLLAAASVSAQSICPAGSRVPDLGYGLVTCHDCIGSTMQGGVPITRYTGSPAIFQIRANGPAAGKLFDGDTLVSVNGNAITSLEAAIALSTWKDGPMTLGVRRGGTLRSVTITPTPTCVVSRRVDQVAPVQVVGSRAFVRDSVRMVYRPADSTMRWVVRPRDTSRFVFRRDSTNSVAPSTAVWQRKAPAPFGMELQCADCTLSMNQGKSIWSFTSLPVVANVEAGSFAQRLGLRQGDTLVSVNGKSLLTPEGSVLLSEGSSTGQVTLAWRRDGMALSAGGILPATTVKPLSTQWQIQYSKALPLSQRARMTQTVGNATVEIKSTRATSTFDPATNQLRIVIGTDTVLVTARVRPDTTRAPR